MKKLFSIILIAMAISVHSQSTTTPSQPVLAPELLVLKQVSHDFGKIQQGRPVTHLFEVSNAGTEPLRIENVQASCGCTTPEWSTEAIKPGGTTTIKVGFNAAAEGPFQKAVTIIFNGNQTKTINISGNVFKASATSAPANSSIALLKQTNQ